jgi:predicted PurR-regulated permease PerM
MPDPTPWVPSPKRIVDRSITTASLPRSSQLATIAVSVAVVAALYLAREVLIPITLAILLSFVLAPVADLFLRLRLGRIVSVVLAVALALSIMLALGGVIGMQVAGLADQAPRYESVIRDKLDTVQQFGQARMLTVIGRLGAPATQPQNPPAPAKTGPASGAAAKNPAEPAPIPVTVRPPPSTPLDLAERILAPVLGPLATTGIVFVVAIFVLLERESLRDRMIRLFGAHDLYRTTTAMDDAAGRLSRYFLSQFGVNAAFGVVIGLGLLLIGIPSPVLWGIVAGLMRFLPYIGTFLAVACPLALAAAIDPGWTMVLETVALFAVCEMIVGQAVEPVLYGRSTGLAPLSVVVAAIFWTWLWGPIGLILSTPLTLCMVVLGRHVDRLEFIDVLLSDRPALTAVEAFYQRVLAGDPDDAVEHAEPLLREQSLTEYYDRAAIAGLRMAAVDAVRGVMDPAEIERVRATVRALIEELNSYVDEGDGAPEPLNIDELSETWRGDHPVLCVSGRGPLDEGPALMLAQLLARRGLNARVTPYASVSRGGIGALDVEGVAIVCLMQLDVSSASYLRYVVRRLRQRVPSVPIVVGLMPRDASPAAAPAIGADVTAATLAEAVEACVTTALNRAAPAAQAVA